MRRFSSDQTGTLIAALTGAVDVRLAEEFESDADDLVQAPALQPTQIVVTITRVDARPVVRDSSGPWKSVCTRLPLPGAGAPTYVSRMINARRVAFVMGAIVHVDGGEAAGVG